MLYLVELPNNVNFMFDNLKKFPIKEEDSGNRLDIILTKLIPDLTRSNFKKIIELGQVKINNFIESSPSKKLKTADIVEINLIPANTLSPKHFHSSAFTLLQYASYGGTVVFYLWNTIYTFY